MKKTTVFRSLAYALILGLLIFTVVPADERPDTGLQHDLEHFVAFAACGMLFALAYPRQFKLLAFGPVVYTLAIELMQIPLPTRHARLEDFIVDTVAAYAGIGAILLFDFWRTGFVATSGSGNLEPPLSRCPQPAKE